MTAQFENARDVKNRLLLEGTLELSSPCHLGGSDPDATSDQPLLRDGDGRLFLAGTTLAGLLRSELEEMGLRDEAALLFGAAWGNPNGKQSRLLVSDAPVLGEVAHPTELRDGVRIDAESGVAEERKKFDLELLPAGTRFHLRFQLELFGQQEQDASILRGVAASLAALEQGRIGLGARTRRGLGECTIASGEDGKRWTLEHFQIATQEGLCAWIARGLDGLPGDWPRHPALAFGDAARLAEHWGLEIPQQRDTSEFTLRVCLRVDSSLLVGTQGFDANDADRVHLHRLRCNPAQGEREAVIPGTSLAGVLRHRCLRIAATLADGDSEGRATKLVNELFGPSEIHSGKPGWASRLAVRETRLAGGQSLRHTRVRIDPWTGGAREKFLFTEDAYYGGDVVLDLRIKGAGDGSGEGRAERALLLLAARDLATGDLAVGAEEGVGRGRFAPIPGRPFAESTSPTATLTLQDDGTVICSPEGIFDKDFDALKRGLSGEEV